MSQDNPEHSYGASITKHSNLCQQQNSGNRNSKVTKKKKLSTYVLFQMKVIYLPVTMGSTKMIFQITNKKSSRLSSSSKNSKKLKSKWHLSAIGINSHHKSSNSPSKLKKLGDLKLKPLFERMKQELNALPPIDLEKESSQFNSTDCLRSR